MSKGLNLTLQVWRQDGPEDSGHFETYQAESISEDMSFLELLDIINEDLVENDQVPIDFDHDCREGICGSCSLMINGQAHGHAKRQPLANSTCVSSTTVTPSPEPFRARAFPVVKDLVVDRSSFDRIIEAGGYISVNTGAASDANLTPVPKEAADTSFDAAACIGCGACVAACPNSAAQLFTSAKLAHLNLIPQGQAQRFQRTENMVETMAILSCTNHGECHEACRNQP